MKYLLLFSLFLVAAKGCGDKKMEGVTTAKIGQEVSLKVGEILQLDGSETQGFRFSSVENDSRCPIGMSCVQAGSANILIEEIDREPKQISIPAKGSRSNTTFGINGAKVKILSLDPYPESGAGKPQQEDYILTVAIMEGNPSM